MSLSLYCLTEHARTLSAKLLAAYRRRDPTAPAPAEPRLIGSPRFVVHHAERIAAETRAPYVSTEHLLSLEGASFFQ